MTILRSIWAGISLGCVLFVIPYIIGSAWLKAYPYCEKMEKLLFSFSMGFFSMLALWELIALPGAYLQASLRLLCGIFSVLILAIAGMSAVPKQKGGKYLRKTVISSGSKRKKHSVYTYLYLAAFLFLLGVQLYCAIFYSRTYMADDGYVAFSAKAVSSDRIYAIDFHTGTAITPYTADWVQRVLQGINFFPAYLSIISGIRASVIGHTVMYAYVILLAYSGLYLVSADLFKKHENRYLFLMLTALLFIYGYHSHYSLTFRLLGPNDEGKAILAVALTPLVLSLLRRSYDQGPSIWKLFAFLMLSAAGMACTLGGAYTFVALIVPATLIASLVYRNWKLLVYIPAGLLIPGVFSVVYLLAR